MPQELLAVVTVVGHGGYRTWAAVRWWQLEQPKATIRIPSCTTTPWTAPQRPQGS
jgi:hypothetical protein